MKKSLLSIYLSFLLSRSCNRVHRNSTKKKEKKEKVDYIACLPTCRISMLWNTRRVGQLDRYTVKQEVHTGESIKLTHVSFQGFFGSPTYHTLHPTRGITLTLSDSRLVAINI